MSTLIVRQLGHQPYLPVFEAMKAFTERRDAGTPDELWLVQHDPVFTQGQAGKAEHVLMPGEIPVVQVDRGGQVTYHGPGQLVAYPLLDLRRLALGVRDLVTAIETAIVGTLRDCGIDSRARPDAPGVYVDGPGGIAKIASLGIRVRRGCSYHGLALNVDMDLAPFERINPCGYQGLAMTRIADWMPAGSKLTVAEVEQLLLPRLAHSLGYHNFEFADPAGVLAATV